MALAMLLAYRAASAAEATAESAAAELPQPFAASGGLLGVTINLLLVLIAIVVLAWVFRRVQGVGQPAAGALQVKATLPLGPRERILLLQVGEEQIVVGASGGGLRTLHVLEQPLRDAPDEVTSALPSFRDRLAKAMGRAPQ